MLSSDEWFMFYETQMTFSILGRISEFKRSGAGKRKPWSWTESNFNIDDTVDGTYSKKSSIANQKPLPLFRTRVSRSGNSHIIYFILYLHLLFFLCNDIY